MSGASNAQPDFPPAGPTDPVLPVLAFTDPGGYPIAIVTNYAVHNNTVGGTCHADLGGRIGDALREQFGPQLVTPFLEAPCADVTWSGPEDGPQKGEELARLIGSSVAESVTVALSETSPVGVEAVRFLTTVED